MIISHPLYPPISMSPHLAFTILDNLQQRFPFVDKDNSLKDHELLPMSQVLSHILNSAEPLVKVRN